MNYVQFLISNNISDNQREKQCGSNLRTAAGLEKISTQTKIPIKTKCTEVRTLVPAETQVNLVENPSPKERPTVLTLPTSKANVDRKFPTAIPMGVERPQQVGHCRCHSQRMPTQPYQMPYLAYMPDYCRFSESTSETTTTSTTRKKKVERTQRKLQTPETTRPKDPNQAVLQLRETSQKFEKKYHDIRQSLGQFFFQRLTSTMKFRPRQSYTLGQLSWNRSAFGRLPCPFFKK